MRFFTTILAIALLSFPVVSYAQTNTAALQAQIAVLLQQIAQLQALLVARGVTVDTSAALGTPGIRTVGAVDGGSELQPGESAIITGTNLVGSSLAKTSVYIGSKKARIESGSTVSLRVLVPSSLRDGKTYALYVKHDGGKSGSVRVEMGNNEPEEDEEDESEDEDTSERDELDNYIDQLEYRVHIAEGTLRNLPDQAIGLVLILGIDDFLERAEEYVSYGNLEYARDQAERAEDQIEKLEAEVERQL